MSVDEKRRGVMLVSLHTGVSLNAPFFWGGSDAV